MNKSSILKKLFSDKTKDYTYVTIFFLIFSFFVVFIIKPNLISVFEANTKIEKLKDVNKQYENQIEKIIEIQSILESNRDELVLINEAIAQKPNVNKVLSDIYDAYTVHNLDTQRTDVSDVNLKDKGDIEKMKSFSVNMVSKSNFEDSLAFVRDLYVQRRLKSIPTLSIDREDREASTSSELQLKLQINGYYL